MATALQTITLPDSFQAYQLQAFLPEIAFQPSLQHEIKNKQNRSLSVSNTVVPLQERRCSVTYPHLASIQPEPRRSTTIPLPYLTELYMSPHPDDICYSCYGKVHKGERSHRGSQGSSRLIVTVFSQSRCCNGHLGEELKQNVDDITKIRKDEDEAFASSVGCKLIQLGLSDSSARDEFSRREELHIESKAEQAKAVKQHPTYAKVENALTDILRWAVKCKATIYMPLGIGCHIDHLMTRVATESILEDIRRESVTSRLPVQVNYFEDLPYATYQSNETIDRMTATVTGAKATEQLVTLDQLAWSQKRRAVEGYATQLKPTIIPSLKSRASYLADQVDDSDKQDQNQLRERVWTLAPGEWCGGF
jgi:LmbE family N-acetylglucosaminyl deacetylase